VAVILNASKSVLVPVGSQFITADGLIFTTDNSYTSRTSSVDVTTANDRLLVNLGNNTYAFTVNVVSEAVGSVYKLPLNTALVPPQVDVSVVRAYAASDFSGGTDNTDDIFGFQADIHHQCDALGTKNRAPDFYA
jgi:hypothetical protein